MNSPLSLLLVRKRTASFIIANNGEYNNSKYSKYTNSEQAPTFPFPFPRKKQKMYANTCETYLPRCTF